MDTASWKAAPGVNRRELGKATVKRGSLHQQQNESRSACLPQHCPRQTGSGASRNTPFHTVTWWESPYRSLEKKLAKRKNPQEGPGLVTSPLCTKDSGRREVLALEPSRDHVHLRKLLPMFLPRGSVWSSDFKRMQKPPRNPKTLPIFLFVRQAGKSGQLCYPK